MDYTGPPAHTQVIADSSFRTDNGQAPERRRVIGGFYGLVQIGGHELIAIRLR